MIRVFTNWYAHNASGVSSHYSYDDFNVYTYGHLQENKVNKIIKLNKLIIDEFKKLNLSFLQDRQVQYDSIIIPADKFIEATNIPKEFESWATVCVRARKPESGIDYDDIVVWSEKHADKIHGDLQFPPRNEEMAEIIREACHENIVLWWKALEFPLDRVLPYAKAIEEMLPRILLGLQRNMPDSNNFIKNMSESDILTVQEMQENFYTRSKSPVSQHVSYVSSFLFGVGCLLRLQRDLGVDMNKAYSIFVETLVAHDPSQADATKNLAIKLGISEDEILNGKKLQQEGQEYIKQTFCNQEAVLDAKSVNRAHL